MWRGDKCTVTEIPEVGPPDAGHRFVAAMAGLHLDAWREMLTAPRMRLA
jgi:hypothetical protein